MLAYFMRVYEQSSGDKPVFHKHLMSFVMLDPQRKLLMRTDVKRREIWEWSDHTPLCGSHQRPGVAVTSCGALEVTPRCSSRWRS